MGGSIHDIQVTGLSEGDQKASTIGDQTHKDFWLKFEIEDTGIGTSSLFVFDGF